MKVWFFIAVIFILGGLFLLTFGLGLLSIPVGSILFLLVLFALGMIYKSIQKEK